MGPGALRGIGGGGGEGEGKGREGVAKHSAPVQ